MTQQKHLKQRVRARMAKTGERYAAAHRQVTGNLHPGDPTPLDHLPGQVPAANALQNLLWRAGVPGPGGAPPGEALTFALAGGIGAGLFTFFYEAEQAASFYIAGRHRWQDDLAYLRAACARLGLAPVVREAGGAKLAGQQLREALADGPAIAWCDAALLPHRAMPASWQGGAYHLVVIYRIDEAAGIAEIGDLAAGRVAIPLADLAAARGRIKAQRHRLLSIAPPAHAPDYPAALLAGLGACHAELAGAPRANFSLEGFLQWAERLHGSRAKERWERLFPPGPRLWQALTSMHYYIEHYGSGGGLARPLFADALTVAADLLPAPGLRDLAPRYAALGAGWRDLADAALPDTIPLCRQAKALHREQAALLRARAAPEAVAATWQGLAALAAQVTPTFPFDESSSAGLRLGSGAEVVSISAHLPPSHPRRAPQRAGAAPQRHEPCGRSYEFSRPSLNLAGLSSPVG
jgi:hypothetical protein